MRRQNILSTRFRMLSLIVWMHCWAIRLRTHMVTQYQTGQVGTELGLIPGALVKVQAVAPYDGVYTIRIGEQTHAVGDAVTKAVLVRPATPDPMSEHTPSANPLVEHA